MPDPLGREMTLHVDGYGVEHMYVWHHGNQALRPGTEFSTENQRYQFVEARKKPKAELEILARPISDAAPPWPIQRVRARSIKTVHRNRKAPDPTD